MKSSWDFPQCLRRIVLCGVLGGLSVTSVLEAKDAEQAKEQLARGNAAGARKTYESLLASQPRDPRLAFNAGIAAHAMGDWESAARHHESALLSEDIGLQQRAFFGLGNARFRQGEAAQDPSEKTRLWEDAARQYQAAMGLNAADTDARANLETVREQLAQLQRQQSKQPDSKDSKEAKDKQDSNDSKQKQDPKQDSGKEGKEGKEAQDSPGRESKDGGKGDRGDKNDGRMQPPDKDGSRDGQGQEQGKAGKDGKGGKDDKGASGQEPSRGARGQGEREGEAGQAGQGTPGGPSGEDSTEGHMAVRFAERLLDAHKREEKALIWSTPKARDERRHNSGRKTW